MKILHIITGLNTGGAEMMLYKLLSAIDRAQFDNYVISLTGGKTVGEKISALGIPVQYLGMAHGRPDLRRFLRLARDIRVLRPDVVQTWMYHADLLGGAAAKLAGVQHVVWNIRNSDLPAEHTKRSTRMTVQLCALLSHWLPDKIICNAQRSVAVHSRLGYDKTLFEVIGNGFDLQRFKPDAEAKTRLCQELRIEPETALVGLVARFDPQKNHRGFIAAAESVAQRFPNVHFILAGRNVDAGNAELQQWLAQADGAARLHLLGERHDMPQLTAALDIAVSCSIYGESFPNSIGEAMACALPCVVTDIGDAAAIVGPSGFIVAPNDTPALAEALLSVLQMPPEARASLGQEARRRIVENFSLPAVVGKYEALYTGLR